MLTNLNCYSKLSFVPWFILLEFVRLIYKINLAARTSFLEVLSLAESVCMHVVFIFVLYNILLALVKKKNNVCSPFYPFMYN